MRLIHSTTYALNEFPNKDYPQTPEYAILSHTWGDGEVSLEDFLSITKKTSFLSENNPAGFLKIMFCCRQAASEGIDYVWVDTCCIDKTNLAELTEAINSMFRWYWEAKVCYAFLSDVDSAENPDAADSKFRKSRWFTRGWTLQELVAPEKVVFYSAQWSRIGAKQSKLDFVVSQVTGIAVDCLASRRPRALATAQIMSWAARRETTKIEDQAYCLMGLFGVNMPLIYGEGERAFLRLQQEIIKGSNDESIFAWTGDGKASGLLATSPRQFEFSGNVRIPDNPGLIHVSNFSLTNRGVQISLPLIQSPVKDVYVAMLWCRQRFRASFTSAACCAVFLSRIPFTDNGFVRIHTHELAQCPIRLSRTNYDYVRRLDIYVAEPSPSLLIKSPLEPYWDTVSFKMKNRPLGRPHIEHPSPSIFRWDVQSGSDIKITLTKGAAGAVLLFKNSQGQRLVASFGTWEKEITGAIDIDFETDDMQEIAHEYLFGAKSQKIRKEVYSMFPSTTLPNGEVAEMRIINCTDAKDGYILVDIFTPKDEDFKFVRAAPLYYPGWWERYQESGDANRSFVTEL